MSRFSLSFLKCIFAEYRIALFFQYLENVLLPSLHSFWWGISHLNWKCHFFLLLSKFFSFVFSFPKVGSDVSWCGFLFSLACGNKQGAFVWCFCLLRIASSCVSVSSQVTTWEGSSPDLRVLCVLSLLVPASVSSSHPGLPKLSVLSLQLRHTSVASELFR